MRSPPGGSRTGCSTGVYAVTSLPVVPQGKARIRTQMAAAHSRGDLEAAAAAFEAVRDGAP